MDFIDRPHLGAHAEVASPRSGFTTDGPRFLVFRFDVDSHRCIRDGVPKLLSLGRKAEARFTFFVNMGRAVDRLATLLAMRRGEKAAQLSARQKLGLSDFWIAALLNPKVGAGRPGLIRRAVREGHEVGLHGGRNHGSWQAGAMKWSVQRIAREVRHGLAELRKTIGPSERVRGFASPGWSGPSALWPVLAANGFDYVADTRGRRREGDLALSSPALVRVPTHLVGEPGGVAYLEHHQAIGSSDRDVLSEFESALQEERRFLVLYDHPCFAVRKLELLSAMIATGRQAGYQVVTLAEVAVALRAGAAR